MKKLTLSIVAALSAVTVFADAAPTMNDGWALLNKGKRPEAEKVFRAIAARESLVDRYSGTHGLMFALRQQKKNEEVVKEVDSWIAKNPDATLNQKASLYLFKGNALRDLRKVDEALAAYKTGADLKSPKHNSSDCAKEYIMLAAKQSPPGLFSHMVTGPFPANSSSLNMAGVISSSNHDSSAMVP